MMTLQHPSPRARSVFLWIAFAVASMVMAGLMVAALTDCTPGQRRTARYALDAMQIACILTSSLVDENAVAQACQIAEDLRPALREALAGKAAAARQGASCLPGTAKGDEP